MPLVNSVFVPESVEEIGIYALGSTDEDVESDAILSGFVIYCVAGTSAEYYANDYGIIYESTTPLVNDSTVPSAAKVGSSVTLTGAAAGGTSPYKYAFYFKKGSETEWKVKGTEYGTAATATLNPGAATTYYVKISVKDNTGAVKDKTFTINVNA